MTDILQQLGPEAPTQTNEQGGKQSAIPVRCDLLPARAVLELAATLTPAAVKYGEDNWRKIPRKDHVNHALAHIFAHLAGDDTDFFIPMSPLCRRCARRVRPFCSSCPRLERQDGE